MELLLRVVRRGHPVGAAGLVPGARTAAHSFHGSSIVSTRRNAERQERNG